MRVKMGVNATFLTFRKTCLKSALGAWIGVLLKDGQQLQVVPSLNNVIKCPLHSYNSREVLGGIDNHQDSMTSAVKFITPIHFCDFL